MKLINFGDICILHNGRVFKSSDWAEVGKPIIRIQNLNDESKPFNYCDFEVDQKYHVKKGDLLFSWSGTPGTSFGAFIWERDSGVLNQHIFRVDIDKNYIDKRYLQLVVNSKLKNIIKQAHGGVGLKHVTKKKLEAIKVPIPFTDERPDLRDQIKTATLLSRVEALIATRKENLRLLDEFLKSTFLEMFGNPVRNEKKWLVKKMDEISDSRLGKMRDKKNITGNHLRVYLGNSNVQWFSFDTKNLLEMDFTEKDRETFELQYGDLLVCEGGAIGRCAIWKNQVEDCYFQKALHRIRLNKTINAEYLSYVFLFFSKYKGFKNVTSKATIAHLTGEKLKSTYVPIPPKNLQDQFTTIVEKVELLNKMYQQNLSELENFYGALSQKAFKGELDLSNIPIEEDSERKE